MYIISSLNSSILKIFKVYPKVKTKSTHSYFDRPAILSITFDLISPSVKNTLVASQPPRETNQDRGESCQAQKLSHVSFCLGWDSQEIICQDIVSDRTIAMLFRLKLPHFFMS